MGNSDIRTFGWIDEIDNSDISGSSVAVDASNWLYKYMTTTARYTDENSYTNKNGDKLTNLIGVPRGMRKFFEYNIQPIFVFDGEPHKLKKEEIQSRKEKRQKANEKSKNTDNSIEKSKYDSRSQRLNNNIIETTKKMLDLLDIPYFVAPKSADAQISYMSNREEIDFALSDDYDCLIFGSQRTVRKFTTSNGEVEIMDFKKTLDKHNINHNQLILATILCGTDYNNGVPGIGPKTAIKKVKKYDNLESLQKKIDYEISDFETIMDLYMNPEIKNDWPNVRISEPDIEGLRTYLDDQQIDLSEVENAISDIDEYSSQTGLNLF